MCGIWTFFARPGTDAVAAAPQLFGPFTHIQPRGPDNSVFEQIGRRFALGFHRLAIMDPTVRGDQPFVMKAGDRTVYALCNGEIYNHHALVEEFDLELHSRSDCEVIPHLFLRLGFDGMIRRLDGEYAILLVEKTSEGTTLYAGRDPLGVRPLFWGDGHGGVLLASELKGLADVCDTADVFPPGHTMTLREGDEAPAFAPFYPYVYPRLAASEAEALPEIRRRFVAAVEKRLEAHRPLGALLSGGLDSSLVCGVAADLLRKHGKRLTTFTIGFENAPDVRHARLVAEHIGSDHHEFIVTEEEALAAIRPTAHATETFDITTIRASTWQWLLGKKIAEHTDVRVLLTGEGSDELASGYIYFHAAPDGEAMHEENVRLLRDIHRYDGLRVDRAMACHGLEVRIPMLDPEFLDHFLSLDPEMRRPRGGVEKHLLREAFADTDYIPEAVRIRTKSAFSDGTSSTERSWFEIVQDYLKRDYPDVRPAHTDHVPPQTHEAGVYRAWFQQDFGERFAHVIPYVWMPRWVNATDPSARTLSLYQTLVSGDN
ncbi:MAG: asparagine synthetase B [Bacteroidetes bacterium]|nr:asparagine synthetase B [Bacteroidota bacterium]